MHTVHKNMTRSHMVVVKLRVNTVCLKYKYIQANHHHTVTSLSTLDVPIPRLPAVLPYVTSLTCLGVSWGKHFFLHPWLSIGIHDIHWYPILDPETADVCRKKRFKKMILKGILLVANSTFMIIAKIWCHHYQRSFNDYGSCWNHLGYERHCESTELWQLYWQYTQTCF